MLKPKILVVNDHLPTLQAWQSVLLDAPRATEYDVVAAASGVEALRLAGEQRFAVVLLDVRMPGMDGYETASLIHARPESAALPIIFVTACYDDDVHRLQGFHYGGADYLSSPVLPQVLYAKVAVFIELEKKSLQLERQKNALALLNSDLQARQMRELQRINAALQAEIVERRQAEERAQDLATRDPLTGLMNRRSLTERLEHALRRAAHCGEYLALLFLDMDKFKSINDALGHDAGDELLLQMAERLRGAVRQSDLVARLGGDEFVVMMESVPSYAVAAEIARKIIAASAAPFMVAAQTVRTSVSIGIGMYPRDGDTVHDLMRSADLAMYHAKQERRGSVQFFHQELNARLIERRQLEHELQQALENDEFELYYQPKVDVQAGRTAGVEALLRWHHPRLGMLSGGQFMAAATETGQVVAIGEWVIASACAQARRWQDADGVLPKLPIAVNIAIPQIYANLPEVIYRALRDYEIAPECLQLEITESLVIRDVERATSVLREISDSGISIAIDDFGTGYSSLSVLKSLPIDTLKIDQSFVRDIGKDLGDSAIVAAVVNMARALALRVVAEGVETEEQQAILCELGCDEHQGYFYGRPLPAQALEAQLLHAACA